MDLVSIREPLLVFGFLFAGVLGDEGFERGPDLRGLTVLL